MFELHVNATKERFHRKGSKPIARMTWSGKESQSLSLITLVQGICRPNSHKCKYGSCEPVLFTKIDLFTAALQCSSLETAKKIEAMQNL